MNLKIKWVSILIIALILISACSLLDQLNPLDEMSSEIKDIAEQLPLEDIQGQIEMLSTDLPDSFDSLATDLPTNLDEITDELETFTTDLPSDLENLTTDIPSDMDEVFDDFSGLFDDMLGSDEIPDDIPILDGEIEELVSSEKIVSYTTAFDFDTVLTFYQEQMPINGWTAQEGNVFSDNMALLYFENVDREATITISHNVGENKTTIMIIIQEKE